MILITLVNYIKNKILNIFDNDDTCKNRDNVYLELDGLKIKMERSFAYDKPHEVSVFVPRAELRKKIKKNDKLEEEIEIILNSITVVHSPQRPSDEGAGEMPEPPEIPAGRIKNIKKKAE